MTTPIATWCSACRRYTARNCLPSSPAQGIPTYWLCTWCGTVDFEYESESA